MYGDLKPPIQQNFFCTASVPALRHRHGNWHGV
jgi:hypothetical protein